LAQFDVFESEALGGHVVDIQHRLLDELSTRAVVPLIARSLLREQISRMNPVFIVAGAPLVFAPQFIATLDEVLLRHPVANLSAHRDEIVAALDFLFTGF